MKTKICPQCKIEKFEDEFVKNKNPRWKGDELASWCKVCNRRRNRAKYNKDKVKISKNNQSRWNKLTDVQKEEKLKKRREYGQKRRMIVLEHYGSKCTCCGESEIKFLEVDHINNNGAQHRKELGSYKIINWLIKNNFPEGFQLLCSNCNMAKGRYGQCPHKKL